MRSLGFFIIAALAFAFGAAYAADLGTPRLSDNLAAQRLFDSDRLLTTGGVKFEASPHFTLEPEVGVGHEKREQELTGYEEMVHKVHARAGGKLSLSDVLYLSAAAKLPVYTYGLADQGVGGERPLASRQEYDLLRRPGERLGWSSEAGVRLGGGTELNLFYDQTPFQGGSLSGQTTEERFGTRLIIRFK